MTDKDRELIEGYTHRLQVADQVHEKNFGRPLADNEKIMIAKCLENTQVYKDEVLSAVDRGYGKDEVDGELRQMVGMDANEKQHNDMEASMKFAMNLTNVVLPRLVTPYVALPYAMTSMSGYIKSTVFTPMKGDYNPVRAEELYNVDSKTVEFNLCSGPTKLYYTPVIKGSLQVETPKGTFYDDGKGNLVCAASNFKVVRSLELAKDKNTQLYAEEYVNISAVDCNNNDESSTEKDVCVKGSIDYETGMLYLSEDICSSGDSTEIAYTVKIAYLYKSYDNREHYCQMRSIPLLAHSRKLDISFKADDKINKIVDDKIANGEIKEEEREDETGRLLADKAVEQVADQIDTEVLYRIIANAEIDDEMIWDKKPPMGVSQLDWDKQFENFIYKGYQILYDRTGRFMPNYILIGKDLIDLFDTIGAQRSTEYTSLKDRKGPYMYGTFDGRNVIVTPNMPEGEFILGVNDPQQIYSAITYTPYMPVVPADLLGFTPNEWPAPSKEPRFATLYDLKMLDKTAIVAGKVI